MVETRRSQQGGLEPDGPDSGEGAEPGGATHHVQTICRLGGGPTLRTQTAGDRGHSAVCLGDWPRSWARSRELTSDNGQQTNSRRAAGVRGRRPAAERRRSLSSPLNSRGPCGPFLRPFGVWQSRRSAVSDFGSLGIRSSRRSAVSFPPRPPLRCSLPRRVGSPPSSSSPSSAPSRPRAPRSRVCRQFSRELRQN
jgi:hypothetical protein